MSRSKYTRELLAPLVASSQSFSEVIRKLGRTPNGGYHRLITARIRQLELDIAHFTVDGRGLRSNSSRISSWRLSRELRVRSPVFSPHSGCRRMVVRIAT